MPSLEPPEEDTNVLDVGAEVSLVDGVPVRDDDVAVLAEFAWTVKPLVDDAAFAVEPVDDCDAVEVEELPPPVRPPLGLAMAELRTTCCVLVLDDE